MAKRDWMLEGGERIQLRRSRFSGKEIKLMLEISYPKDLSVKYPAGAATDNPVGWLVISIS